MQELCLNSTRRIEPPAAYTPYVSTYSLSSQGHLVSRKHYHRSSSATISAGSRLQGKPVEAYLCKEISIQKNGNLGVEMKSP